MKTTILYVLILLVFTLLSGCSTQRVVDSYNDLSVAMSGNKPPAFFKVDSVEEANNLKLTSKHFSISMPMVSEKDFTELGGWHGSFNGKDLSTLYLYESGFYHMTFSASISPYTARARAVEYKDNQYILTSPTTQYGKDNKGKEGNINVHYETHGKEDYTCVVSSWLHQQYGAQGISYGCYKFNPERTMAKRISIRLIYTRVPNLPKELEPLANEYTYEDLQKRAQRVLDSLYIKDGWEK